MRNFYVKALENSEIKVSEMIGLKNAINGNYAFFVSETVARRMINQVFFPKRCELSELQTKTRGTLALPIPNNSPYKKIINIR